MRVHAVWQRFSIVLVLGAAGAIYGNAQAPGAVSPAGVLVRQIDHIVIDSDQPENLFRLFSDKLEMPLGFPYKSYGKFSSGGVGLGNVIVETIHVESLHPGLAGVAFEPSSIPDAVERLDARGLKHGPPAPVSQKDASGNDHGWTTLDLDLPVDGFFFCKYNFSVEPRRKRIHDELQARNGGPLGIDSVVEVVVGVRDLAAAQRDFRTLLGKPQSVEESVWAVGDGPAIRLIADKEDHLALLRVKVKSLERARAYLRAEHLLGEDTEREISLDRSRVGKTDIWFVE